MTCIVGMEFNNKVYMKGDVCSSNGEVICLHTRPKVFEAGEVIIGYTSSYRFGQVMELYLNDVMVPASDDKIYQWLIRHFIPDLKKYLDENDAESGNALIGIKGELWEIQDDFSVLRRASGFNSVGSGYQTALASMQTYIKISPPQNEKDVDRILLTALEVSASIVPSVSGSSDVISTKERKR